MNHRSLTRRRRAGFSFLEIMMVVVIIGILLAIVGPRLAGRTQRARVTAARTQINSISTALKQYEMDMGSFPEQSEGLQALRVKPRSDDADAWDGPYLDKDIPLDPWGQPYQYKFPGENNPKDFDLWSNGPDKKPGTDDDITNWTRAER